MSQLWYAVPLVIAFSFCYAGTRHEEMKPILFHALRWIFWFAVISGLLFLLLFKLT